jgi:MinD superfamily P-loop ATPase
VIHVKILTVISGKGGTGKTTIVSAIHDLIPQAIMADCDVDAPNLHLLLETEKLCEMDYQGAKEAYIDKNICSQCGVCQSVCRFGAIDEFSVDPLKCEGCGACRVVCSAGAIALEPVVTGRVNLDRTQRGLFAHALLHCGAEGSGKLVTEVRQLGEKHRTSEPWMVIDGAPGIGCSVIASITGADCALVVTEPTLSGLSDLKRVLEVAEHFQVPPYVCINKADINEEVAEQISHYCRGKEIAVIGRIPFDKGIYDCLQQKKPITEYAGPAGREIRTMWQALWKVMNRRDAG